MVLTSQVTEKSFSVIILQAAARKYTHNLSHLAVKDIKHWEIIIYMAQLVLTGSSNKVDYNRLDIQLRWKTRYAHRFWFTKLLVGGYFKDRVDKIPTYDRKDTIKTCLNSYDQWFSQFLHTAGYCIRPMNFMGSQWFKNQVPRNLFIHTVQQDYRQTVWHSIAAKVADVKLEILTIILGIPSQGSRNAF